MIQTDSIVNSMHGDDAVSANSVNKSTNPASLYQTHLTKMQFTILHGHGEAP